MKYDTLYTCICPKFYSGYIVFLHSLVFTVHSQGYLLNNSNSTGLQLFSAILFALLNLKVGFKPISSMSRNPRTILFAQILKIVSIPIQSTRHQWIITINGSLVFWSFVTHSLSYKPKLKLSQPITGYIFLN